MPVATPTLTRETAYFKRTTYTLAVSGDAGLGDFTAPVDLSEFEHVYVLFSAVGAIADALRYYLVHDEISSTTLMILDEGYGTGGDEIDIRNVRNAPSKAGFIKPCPPKVTFRNRHTAVAQLTLIACRSAVLPVVEAHDQQPN